MRELLGKGTYGKVFKINNSCAVKSIDRENINIIEPCIMASFFHENILGTNKVNLIKNLNIHCDLAECDLSYSIYTKKIFKKEWISQIKKGLDFLHERNIIHGDIKCSNILDFGSTVKICDFSLSLIKEYKSLNYVKESKLEKYKLDSVLCTPNYRPPEIWMKRDFNHTVDLWSYGCLVFEILNKKFLFSVDLISLPDSNVLEEYNLFFENRQKFFVKYNHKHENKEFDSIIFKYLSFNPKDREDPNLVIKNSLKYNNCQIDFSKNIFTQDFTELKKDTLLCLKKSNFKCLNI